MITSVERRRLLSLFRRSVVTPEGCFEWRGAVLESGYGQYDTGTKNLYVHRMAYEIFGGPIPPGEHVHHLCENKRCWNPHHLRTLTASAHWRIGNNPSAVRARATHCQHGHEFTFENTYVNPKHGYRTCRTCARAIERNRPKRKRRSEA